MKTIFAFGLFLLASSSVALADGESIHSSKPSDLDSGSDASFDPRLPPVLPGEEVKDGKKSMKVWSTSGPIPVDRAPEPFKEEEKSLKDISGADVGVIVDQRKDGVISNENRN